LRLLKRKLKTARDFLPWVPGVWQFKTDRLSKTDPNRVDLHSASVFSNLKHSCYSRNWHDVPKRAMNKQLECASAGISRSGRQVDAGTNIARLSGSRGDPGADRSAGLV